MIKFTNVVDKLHHIFLFNLLFALKCNHTIVVEVAVVAEQAAQTGNNVVDNQLVKALQEDCTQVLVQKVDVAEAKDLFAVLRIPSWHMIKVETSVHLSQNIPQQTTHKS